MTVRNPIVCISCHSKIITRTQIGHKDMRKHSFPCPTCGVVITYILDLDQENASFKFRDPENGKWADDEDGAVKTLTFSDEIVVPASMPDFISPHIATWGRYDWKKYREDEGLVFWLGPLLVGHVVIEPRPRSGGANVCCLS